MLRESRGVGGGGDDFGRKRLARLCPKIRRTRPGKGPEHPSHARQVVCVVLFWLYLAPWYLYFFEQASEGL